MEIERKRYLHRFDSGDTQFCESVLSNYYEPFISITNLSYDAAGQTPYEIYRTDHNLTEEDFEDIRNRISGSTSGETSGSTSGDTSGSTSGETSGSTSGETSGDTEEDIVTSAMPLTLKAMRDGTFFFASNGDLLRNVKYRTTNNEGITSEWQDGEFNSLNNEFNGTEITIMSGETIEIVGDNTAYAIATNTYDYISANTEFIAYGNMASLISSTNFASSAVTGNGQFTFYSFFKDCQGLRTKRNMRLCIPGLKPYQSMLSCTFANCQNMQYSPQFLGENYGCGARSMAMMFSGCTSLIEAPTFISLFTASAYSFQSMFAYCTSLEEPPIVGRFNGKTIANNTFSFAFANCTSLKHTLAIELNETNPYPLTSAFCYTYRACTSLKSVDSSALGCLARYNAVGCMAGMFMDCTGLTHIDKDLFRSPNITAYTPNTVMCMDMFRNCTSLVDSPDIPFSANTGGPAKMFFGMFKGCTSLVTPPKIFLLRAGLNCFESMFENCSSLESMAEMSLTYITGNTFISMYKGCTSLSAATICTIPTTATTLGPSVCKTMFSGCTSLVSPMSMGNITALQNNACDGMYAKCSSLTGAPVNSITSVTTSSMANMFLHCTSLTYVPQDFLKPTSLNSSCYSKLFRGCTSLEIAPDLPATTLATTGGSASNAYQYLFNGCTSLRYIKCMLDNDPENTNFQAQLIDWTKDVAPNGIFVKAAGSSWPNQGLFYSIPAGWEIQEA